MQAKWGKSKSWTVLLSVLIILALVVSACGGSNNKGSSSSPSASASSSSPSSSPSASGEPEPSASESSAPAEKVTIEFWQRSFEETTNKWFKKYVDEFNKSQDQIQIKYTLVPGEAWDQKMKASQAAGKAPEVYTMNYGGIANAAKLGQILPLNDLMDPVKFDDIYDNVKEFITAGGKYYAYPKLVEPSAVLYYRKDLFQAAGLDPEKPPTTWAELLEDAKKLTGKGVFGFSTAQVAGDLGWSSWGLQFGTSGHEALTSDWSKADINNDAYKAVFKFYQDAYQSGVMPKQALAPYPDMKPYGEGKVAMQVNGSWAIGQLRNSYKDKLEKTGIAPMPSQSGDPASATATLGGWTLVVDGKAKHPHQAADFISYLLAGDPAIMIDFFKTSGFSKFSARKSVDEAMKSDPDASKDAWRALIAEKIIPNSKAEPIYPWDVSMAVSTGIESAMKGTSVDKAIEKAEKTINDFIANNKLAGTNPKQ
ncbi:ABC transporter substrate-binding protein [Cohnella silvisoli]|uniref:Sugar ABC transporter substrate-binding protein n=1 Tax=Cohnella silvisoli TaxID=2873699 RepID=A0ABV1KRM2_9BACL|nr:sugar ABC transporter substrate-binding protein [Cohnella silvisoli]MCD9021709.1 sugar ABC transporter substrate-binding protein [Cohnella silvisoli]